MTKYGEKGKGSGGSTEDEATPQDGRAVVVHRSGRDHNLQSTQFPMFTRSNYGEWSILMKVILQARYLWEAVTVGTEVFRDERSAMEVILRSVPLKLVPVLGAKKTAKDAWDALKSMRMGSVAVREARAQGLCKEFEAFGFRSGETIDDCVVRLTTLVGKMVDQSEVVTEGKMVCKFLRAVPRQFALVAYTIESTVDLDTTSIEDIAGRLKGAEERLAQAPAASFCSLRQNGVPGPNAATATDPAAVAAANRAVAGSAARGKPRPNLPLLSRQERRACQGSMPLLR